MGSIFMLLFVGDKMGQDKGFKLHSYLEIVTMGIVCLFVFPKLFICSCGLEIASSQDNTFTCLVIRYFATNIPTALIFKA